MGFAIALPSAVFVNELSAKARAAGRAAVVERAEKHAADLSSTIAEIQSAGAVSLRAIAAALNDRSIPTARGAGRWSAVQVSRVLARL